MINDNINNNNDESARLKPWQIAYLLQERVNRLGKKAHFSGGSEDLRTLLPTLNLNNVGDDALILIRPYIHSMPLYLRVMPDNTVLAFLGDSQGWQWRYYPTRDIAQALVDYFGDSVRIVLSNTPLQAQDIQTGCVTVATEMLRYFAQHGEAFSKELTSLSMSPSKEAGALPVFVLAENVLPQGLKQALSQQFKALTQIPTIWKQEAPQTFEEQVIVKALQQYKNKCKNISFDETSSEFLNNVTEWQSSNAAQLPLVTAAPTYQWRLLAPNQLQLTIDHPDRFYYGNAFLRSTKDFPTKNNLSNSEHVFKDEKDIQVDVNDKELTITVTAKDAKTLRNAFDKLLQTKTQQQLFKEGFTQLSSLQLLAHEAKEIIDLAQIQQNNRSGGLSIAAVNLALKHFLSHRNDIVVLTEHYSLSDQKDKLPELIAHAKLSGCRYVAFSYAMNEVHQVLVIIDHEAKTIMQVNSENNENISSIKNLLQASFPNYQFENKNPLVIQKDQYSCGVHVVLNALDFFGEDAICKADGDLTEGIRQILRASFHTQEIAYKQNIVKLNEDKLIKQLLPILKSYTKNADIEKLYSSLSKATEQENFSLSRFIEALPKDKDNLALSRLLQSIYALTLISNVVNDENKLKKAIYKLIDNSIKLESMTADKEWKMRSIIENEIKFSGNDAVSEYDRQKKLEQALENYLVNDVEPSFFSDDDFISITSTHYPKENIDFNLCHLLAEQLLNFEKLKVASNKSLQTELQQKKLREEKFTQALEIEINDFIHKLGDENKIFIDVLKKLGSKTRFFSADEWVSVLKHFPKDPNILDAVLKTFQDFFKQNDQTTYSSSDLLLFSLLKNNFEKIVLELMKEEATKNWFTGSDLINLIVKALDFIPSQEALTWANKYQDHIKNGKDLFIIARRLPANERYDFIVKQKDKIDRTTHLELFEATLPKQQYFSLVQERKNNILILKFDDLIRMLDAFTSDSEFIDFILLHRDKIDLSGYGFNQFRYIVENRKIATSSYWHDKIENVDAILDMAKLIPESQQLAFIAALSDKIKTPEELIRCIKFFSLSNRAGIANALSDKIENGIVLLQVSELLLNDQLDFIVAHADKIKNIEELVEILDSHRFLALQLTQRLKYKIQNGKELALVVDKVSYIDKAAFVLDEQDKIKTGYELADVLAALKEKGREQLSVAQKLSYKIKSLEELLKVLDVLIYKTEFIDTQEDNIKDGYALAKVIECFANSDQNYYIHTLIAKEPWKSKIQDIKQFFAVLSVVPAQEKRFLLNTGSDLLHNIDDIVTALNSIDKTERFDIIRYNLARRTPGIVETIALAKTLPDDLQIGFVKENLFKIKNIEPDLVSVLHFFSDNEKERVEIANDFSFKLENGAMVVTVAMLLPPSNQQTFIEIHKRKAQNGYELAKFLSFIPEAEHYRFINAFTFVLSELIADVDQLCAVLKALNPSLRFDIASTLVNKIHTSDEISQVRSILSKEEQTKFMQPEKPHAFQFVLPKIKARFFGSGAENKNPEPSTPDPSVKKSNK